MKLSVSLPEDDVAFLDQYANRTGTDSRSAVLHQAIGLLRMSELEEAYADAWNEWEGSEDSRHWEGTAADGFPDAAR